MKQNRAQVDVQAHRTFNVQNLESRIRTPDIPRVCFTLGTNDSECGLAIHIISILSLHSSICLCLRWNVHVP